MKVYNLNELTNSRVLYDKDPPKFFNFIILIVLILLIGFIVWSTNATKTFIVKGNGIVTTENKTSIMTKVSGEIDEVFIKEGQSVKKGDLLLVINAPDLNYQQSQINGQIDVISERINLLKRAERSTSNGTNKFNRDDSEEAEIYNRLNESYSKSVEYNVDEESLIDQNYTSGQINQLKEQSKTKKKQIYYETINGFIRERKQLEIDLQKLKIQKKAIEDSYDEYKLYACQNGIIHLNTSIKKTMVVQAGAVIGSISDTSNNIIISATIQSVDRPRIHEGDEVAIAIGGLNQTEYGTLEGRVESIDEDATVDEDGNIFFKIKVKPEKTYLKDKKGEKVNLVSGMITETRVKYEKVTYANYLLEEIGIQFN